MSTTFEINQEVAEQRHASERQQESTAHRNANQNVGPSERKLSVTAGAILAGIGLVRGGSSGLAMLGMGGALVYRGATGHCSVYQAVGVNTCDCSAS